LFQVKSGDGWARGIAAPARHELLRQIKFGALTG